MEPIEIGLWVSGGMLVFVVLGMRVAFAAGLAGFVGLFWLRWNGFDYDPDRFWKALEISVKIAGLTPHSKVSAQVLSLIPVFIMIGYLAYYAKLTTALFEACKRWFAWVPGGLAVSTVFATAGFAAVSGASVATAAVFARIAIPEMLKVGYNKQFAAGVVAAGGTAPHNPCHLRSGAMAADHGAPRLRNGGPVGVQDKTVDQCGTLSRPDRQYSGPVSGPHGQYLRHDRGRRVLHNRLCRTPGQGPYRRQTHGRRPDSHDRIGNHCWRQSRTRICRTPAPSARSIVE